MRSLSVVCPVYNEEEVIGEFYQALAATLRAIGDRYSHEIIFVVDRGTDRTLEILRGIAARDARVRVLALSARFGHQMSLLAGIDHCDADAVVMLDSDLQHPPELIPVMLEEFEQGNDIVYAVREGAANLGVLKRLTSRLFYQVANRLASVRIEEAAADFRLISRRVARIFQTQLRERNQFIRGLVGWVGFRHSSVRFRVQPRFGGVSKYTLSHLVRFAVHGIVSFSKRPLHAAIVVGFAFAVIALLMASITVLQWALYRNLPSGWTTLVTLICGFSGVQLIFLGIIGQYIGAIFDEVKARPHYLVEEKINFDGV